MHMHSAESKQLQRSPVAFILGAGASVPLGMPTTFNLRERLCDDPEDGNAAVEIHKSAAYRFKIPADAINIEYFLEHLYELQLMLWLARRSDLPTVLPGFTANAPITGTAGDTLRRLNRRAYQLLHETCGDCSGTKAETLWRPLLGVASSVQSIVPVFTLNYDWTFERLAIENMTRYQLVDGYELLGGEWDGTRFDTIMPHPKKITVALFKLHGSTNWLGGVKSLGSFKDTDDESGDDMPPHKFEMVYPAHAHEKRFGKEYWEALADPYGDEGPWMEQDPYKTLYAHFHNILGHARLIVVIGYAFGDRRVNRELVDAVAKSTDTEVLVVDPGNMYRLSPFDSLKYSEHECPWSRFTWLQGRFGDAKTTTAIVNAIKRINRD
jgi:SIR2-like protein